MGYLTKEITFEQILRTTEETMKKEVSTLSNMEQVKKYLFLPSLTKFW